MEGLGDGLWSNPTITVAYSVVSGALTRPLPFRRQMMEVAAQLGSLSLSSQKTSY
jgi:hypothetical protein